MQLPVIAADAYSLVALWRDAAPAGFLATCAFLWRVNAKLVRIETILTGATGENGLVGNAAELERRVRTLETR